jgi:hypothetical protein
LQHDHFQILQESIQSAAIQKDPRLFAYVSVVFAAVQVFFLLLLSAAAAHPLYDSWRSGRRCFAYAVAYRHGLSVFGDDAGGARHVVNMEHMAGVLDLSAGGLGMFLTRSHIIKIFGTITALVPNEGSPLAVSARVRANPVVVGMQTSGQCNVERCP